MSAERPEPEPNAPAALAEGTVSQPIVTTAPERCRRCYSCVRRCPAKAIRVSGGRAEVLAERCVACGRCLSVCSQNARRARSNLPHVRELLRGPSTVALVAPSFAATFSWTPGQTVAALRRLGFTGVHEVAFGADLVARRIHALRRQNPDQILITTPCPAATAFVRKYFPELIPFLAPVLSPMAAMGKALKERLRPGCRTVFVGPCTAKMAESEEGPVSPWIDAVLTFSELGELLGAAGVDPARLTEVELDPPRAGLGAIFPVAGGLARAAEVPVDLLENEVAEVSGPDAVIENFRRLSTRVAEDNFDTLETRLFDVLFCKGCLAGPAMCDEGSLLVRKERVVEFIRSQRRHTSRTAWQATMSELADLDLGRGFAADDQRRAEPTEEQIRAVLERTGKRGAADELNCRACGYPSCRDKAAAVVRGLAEEEMCLPHLIERLEDTIGKLNLSHEQLTEAQSQLIRSERLASMGQLAAGIAHEVNNPLGTILIFSHLLADGLRGLPAGETLRPDVEMILNEAKRCKGIVGGLLDFARQNKVDRQPLQVADLVAEATRIAAAQHREAPVRIESVVADDAGLACLDRQQMLQVLLNLVKNAVEAMPQGGAVTLGARRGKAGELLLTVSDEGRGIPAEAMPKLFSPFYTTKPVGHGTGLGLPICYGIVKMHRGQITARNNPGGKGACFEIALPAEEPTHV